MYVIQCMGVDLELEAGVELEARVELAAWVELEAIENYHKW